MNSRAALRTLVRTRRQTLSLEEQQQASDRLIQHLSTHPKVNSAQTIALYLANDGELNPTPFIEWCWQHNKRVYLPVLHPFCSGHLLFLLFERNTPMVKNIYGIEEPTLNVTKVCPLAQLDVLCTPLVAFDAAGARLGMGGGFYDRTLTNWQQHHVYPIGIAHDCQQVKKIPVEHWDIPLPEIITPSQRYIFM
ncbi:5-formyltetrahydrofolate cyclo-ligase [Colwellia sp. MSW7]|jgi:5-formyltetrahydrofolate cyclo-ligase|uniref:5-formyltetrahydrofolate cyclo-ligase n=1 Tax=Colwellia maritima TaxID=2912588 RepID=A0ABS9X354_9GAMM|nr:5-formyltetrahydrofolate cyclo-ligase [Colwellia maritima]MCI2283502.1 5-formyltetrahydrofolate cyclo-ligase [Colwellia maritima]